jgi:integrase/recombinase XerD
MGVLRSRIERVVPEPSPAVASLIEQYLADRRSLNYSPRTIVSFARALRDFALTLAEAGIERVQDVKSDHLEAFRLRLKDRAFSAASIELYSRSVRKFFDWLEKRQVLFENPGADFLIPKPDRPLLPVPTVTEIQRLLAQPNVGRPIGLRDRALIETAYATGARLEEICRLKIFDPDLSEARLRILGKGRKERAVPLGKHAVYWIKQYLLHGRPPLIKDHPEHDRLWVGQGGEKISGAAIRVQIRKHAKAAGIKTPISPHTLRRACATHMLRNGAHPVQIQMLLGHADLRSLSQYLRVSITDLKKMHRNSKPGR